MTAVGTLYDVVSTVSALAWAAVLAYCSPAVWRVVLNDSIKRGDLLAVLLAGMAFVFLGYRLVGLMFATSSAYGQAELMARAALGLLSVLCSVMCLRVLRQYRIR